MKFVAMFQPIQIGPVTVKNRFVVPPMGNNFANTDGTMSEQSVAYYRERAKGGSPSKQPLYTKEPKEARENLVCMTTLPSKALKRW